MANIDLNAIYSELVALSALRQRVVKENDTVGRLFASLRQDTTIPPSWDDLQRAESALQSKVPGFFLWWIASEHAYTLLPDLEYTPAPAPAPGDVIFEQGTYQEILLASESGARLIAGIESGAIVKLFRIEWHDVSVNHDLHTVQYTLPDAIKAFREAIAIVKEEHQDAPESEQE